MSRPAHYLALPVLAFASPCFAQAVPESAVEETAPSPEIAPTASDQRPVEMDAAELAKELANPLASVIVIPIQQDIDFGIGPDNDGVKATLNVQPLIPIDLTHGSNLISRTIFSVIYMNAEAAGESVFGLGDTLQSFFVSPKNPTKGGIIWGAGPVILLPTATDPLLGGQKWGAGPTFVALKQKGGWTAGALINHIWSFVGNDSRDDISQTYMEPFVYYTWPSTVSVSASVETLYDWKIKAWTAPINVLVSKIVRIGKQDASIAGGARYFIERPVDGPNWGLRMSLTLLFPKH